MFTFTFLTLGTITVSLIILPLCNVALTLQLSRHVSLATSCYLFIAFFCLSIISISSSHVAILLILAFQAIYNELPIGLCWLLLVL